MINNLDLQKEDKEVYEAILNERKRQEESIELIASENFVSNAVREANGSILTNKYAEGYPSKRYYGGCENVDVIETLAIERAKKLFHCDFANVQPHSGSSANMAAYKALMKDGDKILGMSLDCGGHLSHGYRLSFSGQDFISTSYGVNPETGLIDYDAIRELAKEFKPQVIVCGASAYPRFIDFKKFRDIADEVNAYLIADIAHIAGLVAANEHPSPFPYAHVVTTTTQKTLRGPRGGLILTNDSDLAKKIDKAVFPLCQGGPLENTIAGKAVAFYEDLQDDFKKYIHQVVLNAKALADELMKLGFNVITGGTDNHLLLVDIKSTLHMTGLEAQKTLEKVNITTNKNAIPNDTEKPAYASGLRLGAPAMTTRGYKEEDFRLTANLIVEALKNKDDEAKLESIKNEVKKLNSKHPLPYELD